MCHCALLLTYDTGVEQLFRWHPQYNDDLSPQYVFTASELPPYFPIPQHIEMSFLPAPPRKLFFCCLEAPTSSGGETCLCDFKKVYEQMNPEIRQKFEEKGVSYAEEKRFCSRQE